MTEKQTKGVCAVCGKKCSVPTWTRCESCDRTVRRTKAIFNTTCPCGNTLPYGKRTWCSGKCRDANYQRVSYLQSKIRVLNPDDPVYTTSSAAKRVGVSRQAIDKMIRRGRIAVMMTNNTFLIKESELLKIYKDHEPVRRNVRVTTNKRGGSGAKK